MTQVQPHTNSVIPTNPQRLIRMELMLIAMRHHAGKQELNHLREILTEELNKLNTELVRRDLIGDNRPDQPVREEFDPATQQMRYR